jgi:hypothetical protein
LDIRRDAESVPVEVEEGTAGLPLSDQQWPEHDVGDPRDALKRLVEIGPVETAAHTDVEPRPIPGGLWERLRYFHGDVGCMN